MKALSKIYVTNWHAVILFTNSVNITNSLLDLRSSDFEDIKTLKLMSGGAFKSIEREHSLICDLKSLMSIASNRQSNVSINAYTGTLLTSSTLIITLLSP